MFKTIFTLIMSFVAVNANAESAIHSSESLYSSQSNSNEIGSFLEYMTLFEEAVIPNINASLGWYKGDCYRNYEYLPGFPRHFTLIIGLGCLEDDCYEGLRMMPKIFEEGKTLDHYKELFKKNAHELSEVTVKLNSLHYKYQNSHYLLRSDEQGYYLWAPAHLNKNSRYQASCKLERLEF